MTNTVKANDGKTYALPDNPVWRKGPPPEIGWWPADYDLDQGSIVRLRHWDGCSLSMYFLPGEDVCFGYLILGK